MSNIPAGEGRRRRDTKAIAMKAASIVLDENVTRKAAMERFGIGWVMLCAAIAQLRRERGAPASAVDAAKKQAPKKQCPRAYARRAAWRRGWGE